MKPLLCNIGWGIVVCVGTLAIAACIIFEAITDWRRDMRLINGHSWN